MSYAPKHGSEVAGHLKTTKEGAFRAVLTMILRHSGGLESM